MVNKKMKNKNMKKKNMSEPGLPGAFFVLPGPGGFFVLPPLAGADIPRFAAEPAWVIS